MNNKPGSYVPKKFKVKKGESLWLLSFSDLSMILIAFFIIMLANSVSKSKRSDTEVKTTQETVDRRENRNNLKTLQEKIEKEVEKSGLQAVAKVSYDSDGLAVEFKDNLIFRPGSADLDKNLNKVVGSVMNVIADAPEKYQLIFEGHTDDTRVIGGKFPSNWELSASRAVTLMRQFEKRGVAHNRMYVSAFADTKPKIPTNQLKGQKLLRARAANRRVVIKIE